MERSHTRLHYREPPSFSSILLDSIYRSIDHDQSRDESEKEVVFYRESCMRKKHNNVSGFERACTVEKLRLHCKSRKDHSLLSSTTSSDSSSIGGFSSSESEATTQYRLNSSIYTKQIRPMSIRTRPREDHDGTKAIHAANTQKPKQEGGFVKTKSKALKIYRDFKKANKSTQPLSPGGKLAGFLNSLFTSNNAKKARNNVSSKISEERQCYSTCSSASSYSRSCLSKSSTTRNSNGTKRSVRFHPVSVIVDEDSRPCGHKNLLGIDENASAIASTRNDLKKHGKFPHEFSDEEDDDMASDASSDLFELDNLNAIGSIDRYSKELPVYETTSIHFNRPIS